MRIAPPSIFPAVVGEVVVVVVLEGDSATGAPKSMRPALWVIATPARALVAPRLLVPTPLPNSGKSGSAASESSLALQLEEEEKAGLRGAPEPRRTRAQPSAMW